MIGEDGLVLLTKEGFEAYDELRKIVTDGRGKMPAIHTVTGKSVDDVIAYIRTLKK
jgi:mono/diheme cytochrome c family protein